MGNPNVAHVPQRTHHIMMNPSPHDPVRVPVQLVDELLAEGETDEALRVVTAVVDQCRLVRRDNPDHPAALADALESRADLLRLTGDHASARDDYEEAAQLLGPGIGDLKQLGRLHVGLGAAYDALGDPDRAAGHWERAIQCFEENQPPSRIAAATMANNLALLKRNVDDFDGAETAFLKALEIFHTDCGPDHEQTAVVAGNLGSLYQFTGHHEPARDMCLLAMRACQKCYGETHPETGQSYLDLAHALASTGDQAGAQRYLDLAREVFERLGPDGDG